MSVGAPPLSTSIFQYPPNFPSGEVADAWQAWFTSVQGQVNGYVTTSDLSAVTAGLAASTGAGLVGFSNSNTYTTGTIGAKAASIPEAPGGPLFALKTALNEGLTTGIQILSDSTGNDTTDWPYLLAQQIAASHPEFTVVHMLWSDVTQTYGSTRLQLGTGGERYLDCDSGTYASLIDPATAVGPSTTSSIIDARIKISATTWTPAGIKNLVSLDGGAAPNIGWRFILNAGGTIGITWSSTGTGTTSMVSTVGTGLAANAVKWIRVLFNPNDGGGNRVGKFYTSDDGFTWTQLGTTVTTAGAVTVNNPLPANGYWLGGIANSPATGIKIYAVDVRDGDTGTPLVPCLPDLWAPYNLGTAQAMVGAPVLTIVNGSHTGANIAYLNNATRLPKMLPDFGQSVCFLSDSHNEAYITSAPWGALYKTWSDAVKAKLPHAAIVGMTQNPETSANLLARVHARRRLDLLGFRNTQDMEIMDIYKVFMDAGFPGALMADTIHPNLAGSTLWATYVKKRIDQAV